MAENSQAFPRPVLQTLQEAAGHHRTGRISEAEPLYREVLTRDPDNADALQLLGLLSHQTGQNADAARLLRKASLLRRDAHELHFLLANVLKAQGEFDEAIAACQRTLALRPDFFQSYVCLGDALQRIGRAPEAIAAYQQAIVIKPDYAEAHCNLGNASQSAGRTQDAIAACRRAISLRPNFVEAWCNLGISLLSAGDFNEAIDACRRALALRPNLPEALNCMGSALAEKGDLEGAVAAFDQAISLRPNFAEAHTNLGNALSRKGCRNEAVAACCRAVELRPGFAEAQANLGHALQAAGRFDEAISACHRAIAIKPDLAQAYFNLGNALQGKGRLDPAIAAYRRAIELNRGHTEAHANLASALQARGQFYDALDACHRVLDLDANLAEAHFNLAFLSLLLGDFGTGWTEYEWRWKRPACPSARQFSQPQWKGEPLKGRTILLHAEQGFGDVIQFVRYAPMVAARGGRVVLECQPALGRLLQSVPNVSQIVTAGETLPHFDLHCPLMSLPLAFGTRLETIPRTAAYLMPDPQLVESWGQRITDSPGSMKIGLAWAGNKAHPNDEKRSIGIHCLDRLGGLEGIEFYSLQKDGIDEDAPERLRLTDLSATLTDFADTAALISHLDIVITIDTAVAHLAGALGKPVWLLLPFVPDWRWLLDREDSPWYPTMRLFRQKATGAWNEVIERALESLRQVSGHAINDFAGAHR